MFLRLFNSKSVYSVILIPLVAFLFWIEPLGTPAPLVVTPGEGMMPLFAFFVKLFSGNPLWPVLTGFIMVLLNAVILSLLSYEFQFLPHRTFLPGILYVGIVSSFPSLQTFHPVYPATFLVLLSVYFIFSTYHRKNEISSTFNASFIFFKLTKRERFPESFTGGIHEQQHKYFLIKCVQIIFFAKNRKEKLNTGS